MVCPVTATNSQQQDVVKWLGRHSVLYLYAVAVEHKFEKLIPDTKNFAFW
jgi:hypothetical protein